MPADKISVTITPELHTALSLAAVEHKITLSRQLEVYLRENRDVQRFVDVVRSEPDLGVLAVHGEGVRAAVARQRRRMVAPSA